jgi:3-oxoacyl-[acyl-carrier protein] reductase
MDLELAGKHALVTGGCDGVGRAIVKSLIQQGVAVAATYAQESAVTASFSAEMERGKNGSFALQADVSDAQSVADMIAHVCEEFGQIDILVNNASIMHHASFQTLTLLSWQRVVDTNLTGVYLVTQAALDIMAAGGSIINVSACLAAVGMRGKSHYSAAKAGVIGLTRSLCKEVGAQGMRVNVIAPGVIETAEIGDLSPEQRKRYAYLSAMGRLGQPEEVAATVLFLASDLSSFITGATIAIDGGVGGIGAF